MMKILIEIPKHIYEHAKEKSEDGNDEWDAMRAIANGTPLPEHHGRLISEEDMLSMIIFSKLFDDAKVGEVKEALLNISTIIKEGDNE